MKATDLTRFFKATMFLALATALVSSTLAADEKETTEQEAKKQAPRPAVVRISAAEGKATSYGSGSLVGLSEDYGLVLTNWHVVRDATGAIMVHFPDGVRAEARLLLTDRVWDLAALLISRPKVEPIPVAAKAPVKGDRLTIAGFGSGAYREATGKVVNFVSPGEKEPFEMLEVNVAARSGDSGGPIFNEDGQVAGVLFGSAGGSTNGSHCERVRWFVRRALAKRPSMAEAIAWVGKPESEAVSAEEAQAVGSAVEKETKLVEPVEDGS
ncbi:MAG TPA: serine protease [Thermoguttaceae bacterium]|nr:serine protease [Thermoguttaceae bacterium]